MIHGRRARVPRRVATFRGAAQVGKVRLLRQDVGGEETYWLERMIGGGRYHRQALHNDVQGGNQFFQLFESGVRLLAASVAGEDPRLKYHGSGWYHSIRAQAYNGAYETSGDAPGEYVEWATPAGTTTVGARWVQTTGRGFALVEIDGDPTRATELPTAGELVADGKLAASALISGGGTLEPTDRLLNQYGAGTNYDVVTLFARDLAPGVHTVRMTSTGYRQAEASSVRIGLSAMLHGGSATGFDAPGVVDRDEGRAVTVPATYELAMRIILLNPTSTSVWVGGSHGNERMAGALVIRADGQPVALANGESVVAGRVVIERPTELLHPEEGGGEVGIVDLMTTYTLTSRGLHVRVQATPKGARTFRYGTTYGCMLSLPNEMTKCSNAGLGEDYDCDRNDNSEVAAAKSDQLWAWEAGGQAAALVWLPDVRKSMNGYAASAKGIWLSDRTIDNKVYPTRRDSGYEDAGPLDIDGWFIWAWWPDADAVLARVKAEA